MKNVAIEDVDIPSSENLEENVLSRELQEKVKKAVSSLPEHHRMVLILKHYQGLSYNEIGEILNCPVGTVKSRMYYALQELKSALA